MKKTVFILLVLAGIVFQIAADNHNQGTPSEPKNPDQPQAAAVQTDVPVDDKTTVVKEIDKNTGGNTPQPQKTESNQIQPYPSTNRQPAHPKSDGGINSLVDPQTPVDSTPDAVDMEAKEQATVHNTENDRAFDLFPDIETDHRLAKEAKELSQKTLSELKQYSRYWDEILICFVLLCMLVIVIIVCILFFTQRKKINELEKSFRQQIKDIQYQQRNSRDNKAIQRDAVEHRSNDRGAQDLLSQAAVKTDIGKKQTSIGQNPKTETVRPKNTGYTEQSNDMRSALYFSEAEREKWLSLNPNYSCLNVLEPIRNRAYRGEAISSTEIALTPSGNMNNALFILLDDKYLYLNFWLYNAEGELPAVIERIVKLVYDFDQPLPRYVKTCQPALVRKTNNGYTIQQKGKIWLA